MHRLEARSVDRHHNDGGGLLDGRKRSRALKTRSASTVYTFCERAKKRRRNTDANAFTELIRYMTTERPTLAIRQK